jgi:hypothetical protein
MRHHKEHVGLQEHSVGKIYPWSIVRIGDKGYQAWQVVSGEKGPLFFFSLWEEKGYNARDARRKAFEFATSYAETCLTSGKDCADRAVNLAWAQTKFSKLLGF